MEAESAPGSTCAPSSEPGPFGAVMARPYAASRGRHGRRLKLLLDTHLLLWAAGQPERLSAQARALIADGVGAGRKIEFLAQEFNREANTLCSKSADIELTRIGIDLKGAIERLREQVQNVE